MGSSLPVSRGGDAVVTLAHAAGAAGGVELPSRPRRAAISLSGPSQGRISRVTLQRNEANGEGVSPFVELDRQTWSRLAAQMEQPLNQEDYSVSAASAIPWT